MTQTSKAALKCKLRAELVVTATRTENARVSAELSQLYRPALRDGEPAHPRDAL